MSFQTNEANTKLLDNVMLIDDPKLKTIIQFKKLNGEPSYSITIFKITRNNAIEKEITGKKNAQETGEFEI